MWRASSTTSLQHSGLLLESTGLWRAKSMTCLQHGGPRLKGHSNWANQGGDGLASDQLAIERPFDWPPVDEADMKVVEEQLGRKPQGQFEVVVRHIDGTPRVLRNAPILETGRPMPTLYWLASAHDRLVVGRLEGLGGVDEAEAAVDKQALSAAHDAYRAERDLLIPDDYEGHRPSAGVGGTRLGVKCLHAHYAYFLARGVDPVGRWVADRLAEQESGADE
jgi:hypothetical protein